MALEVGEANLISIFVRTLKPGKTYEEFRQAWYPDKGFGIPVRVVNAINTENESEVVSVGFMKLPEHKLDETIERIAEQEAVRHSRIEDVVERVVLKGIYRIVSDDDLS